MRHALWIVGRVQDDLTPTHYKLAAFQFDAALGNVLLTAARAEGLDRVGTDGRGHMTSLRFDLPGMVYDVQPDTLSPAWKDIIAGDALAVAVLPTMMLPPGIGVGRYGWLTGSRNVSADMQVWVRETRQVTSYFTLGFERDVIALDDDAQEPTYWGLTEPPVSERYCEDDDFLYLPATLFQLDPARDGHPNPWRRVTFTHDDPRDKPYWQVERDLRL